MRRKRKYSWIAVSIVAYFIVASLCMFFPNTDEYRNYFWYVTLVFNILALGYNFKIIKTNKEIFLIGVVFVYRIFCLLYFLVGTLLKQERWMNENLFFICSVCASVLIVALIKLKNREIY